MNSKVCLINPPTTREGALFFPMSLITLGSFLKSKNIPVEIIDFDLELRSDSSLFQWNIFKNFALDQLARTGADIFGISSICSNFPISILMAQEIRHRWPEAKIILGGPQPSAVPEQTLRLYPWIDVIAIGEGEITLHELVTKDWESSLHQIPGIAYRTDTGVFKTAKRELISNLDDLPFPDYSLINLPKYQNPVEEPAYIEAGRGCPFLCSFCSTSLMWERKYRAKSPARILEEMHRLKAGYDIHNSLGLTHDNFTTSSQYVSEFCGYLKENNKQGMMWSVSARPDTVNPKRLKELQEAGCRGLFYGVDTGSQRMQKTIHKHLKLSKFENLLQETVDLKIGAVVSFIIGYPEETEEDLNETLTLALRSKRIGAKSVQIHKLSPLAGTPVLESNLPNLYYDPACCSYISYTGLQCEEQDEIIRSSKELFSSFYSIPTPLLTDLRLGKLAVFYTLLINFFDVQTESFLEVSQWTPTELFRNWEKWIERQAPQAGFDWRLVLNTVERYMSRKAQDFDSDLCVQAPFKENSLTSKHLSKKLA